jgi:hypothetical protein
VLDLPETILATLPPLARAKLEFHAEERAAAHEAYRSARDREDHARGAWGHVRGLADHQMTLPAGGVVDTSEDPAPGFPARLRAIKGSIKNLPAALAERENRIMSPVRSAEETLKRRIEARERAAARQENFAFLETVESWLRRAATPGGEFRAADPVAVKSKNPAADLAKARARLAEIDEDFSRAEAALTPKSDLIAAAHAEIDAVAASGALSIHPCSRSNVPLRLKERFTLGTFPSGSLMGDAGATIWTWLLRDALKAEVANMVEALPDGYSLTDSERDSVIATLAEKRLQVEREEEALIELLEDEDRVVVRRRDIDPRAFLGIAA